MPKTALITGAARRLGAAIALALHRAGYRVAIHHRHSAAAAQTLARRLNAVRADSAITLRGDLTDMDTPARLVAEVAKRWRRLDVLVNNAAVYRPTPLVSAGTGDWDDIMGTNLRAPFLMCRAAAPLLDRHRGAIVNLTDLYAAHPRPGYPLYCASKAGLIGLTKALALDLAPRVRVNAVSPGAILWAADTDPGTRARILAATPLTRPGTAGEIGDTVVFLAGARFITGQVIEVDGGRTLQV